MMMGKTFQIALLTMLAMAPATAQTLTSPANAPREGDRLELLPVAVPDVGEAGRDRLWDFSDLQLLDGKLKVEHLLRSDTTDTLMAIARRTRHYSVLRGDTLLSPGTENNLWLIRYTLPETLLRFPFAYGDSLAAPFLGTSQYCERTYHRTYGLSTVKADALGTLVTPDGDTLRHVLRVHARRTEGAYALPVYTEPGMRRLLAALPPFTADSVHVRLAADTPIHTTDTYRFFAPGYRYPVLTVTTEGMGGTPARSHGRKRRTVRRQWTIRRFLPPARPGRRLRPAGGRRRLRPLLLHAHARRRRAVSPPFLPPLQGRLLLRRHPHR